MAMGKALPVEIEGLTVTYRLPGGRMLDVLDGLDLSIEAGSLTCILGPTGCGKTTLLRAVAGLETPSSGRVSTAPDLSPSDIGFVFQQHGLFPWMNVHSNIGFGPRAAGLSRAEYEPRIESLVRLVGLEGFEQAWPYQLSGGMQQRASLARSLAAGPGLLLMDEPLGSLDEGTRFVLEDVILDLWKLYGTTVLFVTHDIEEAVYMADRIIVLGRGTGVPEMDEKVLAGRPRDRLDKPFTDLMLEVRRVVESLIVHAPGAEPPAPSSSQRPTRA